MKKIILITSLILANLLFAEIDFKVMTWNALRFPSESGNSRLQYFQTVFEHVTPDIILMQEMESTLGSNMMLETLGDEYERAEFVIDSDLSNILYYKPDVVALVSQDEVDAWPRVISEYVLQIDGNPIRFYSCHLKSSQGSANEEARFEAVAALRSHLNNLPAGTEFIIAGDMNIYTSSEDGYQKFIANEANNIGRSRDLTDEVGNWHDNSNYSSVHTQCTRVNQFGGGASGGLDDRFDFILASYNINNGSGIEYVENSLQPIGNDGNHFNDSINDGYNSAVPANVANALYSASDHLPVIAEFTTTTGSGTTIADIQTTDSGGEGDSPMLGQSVLISGIVTAVADNGYFIQDASGAWNGIFVYDTNTPDVGDEVMIGGVVGEFYSQTQISDVSSFNISSSGNAPEVITLQTGDVSQERYESVLVQVTDAICTDEDLGYGEWMVNDGSGEMRVDDMMYEVQPEYNDSYNLRGIVGYSYDNYKLEPRSADDVNFVVSVGGEELQIMNYELRNSPNPFNPSTKFSFLISNEQNQQNEQIQIEIYNLKGKKVKTVSVILSGVEVQSSIIWNGDDESGNQVSSGLYFARLIISDKEVASKKMLLIK